MHSIIFTAARGVIKCTENLHQSNRITLCETLWLSHSIIHNLTKLKSHYNELWKIGPTFPHSTSNNALLIPQYTRAKFLIGKIYNIHILRQKVTSTMTVFCHHSVIIIVVHEISFSPNTHTHTYVHRQHIFLQVTISHTSSLDFLSITTRASRGGAPASPPHKKLMPPLYRITINAASLPLMMRRCSALGKIIYVCV